MGKFTGMDQFLKEKLRAPTMTAHDSPDGGDTQLEDAAAVVADEAGDFPYTPPIPVPLSSPTTLADGQRGQASETWLMNPPTTLPGLGNLVGGGTSEKGSQFPINSIRIDNLTSQWIYFPENGAWVPPFWFGRVMRFTGSRVQRVRFETPAGLTALAASSTSVARVMFSNEYWDEQPGSTMAGNVASTTTGAPALGVTIYDDLSGLPAEVQTPADALANQAGLVTDSFTMGWNGASWDRVRAGADNADGVAAIALGIQRAIAELSSFAGTTGWVRNRVPNIFKTFGPLAIGASSTATVWTPAAGLRPRLLGFLVNQTSISAADGIVTFFDNTTTGAVMGGTGWLNDPTLNVASAQSAVNFGGFGPIVATSSSVILAWSSNAINIAGMVYGVEE